MAFDPRSELVEFTVNRVQKDNAPYAIADTPDFQAPGGRQEASAIADDHDRHLGKCLGGCGIAVEAGEIVDRFCHEALETAGLPEFACAGIRCVNRHLWREEHRVHAGI